MKHAAYDALVAARKVYYVCESRGLTNPATMPDFDSDRIGPYSRWQGKLDSELMVVAQDFADVESFKKLRGWPGPRVPTNLVLVDLLRAAGIEVNAPEVGQSHDRVFFTNAVLCLKRGGMNARIATSCFRECGSRFLRPLIEIVRPRAIAAVGRGAHRGVLEAFPQSNVTPANLVERREPFDIPGGARVFPLFHPSRMVLNSTRSRDQQIQDWVRVGEWLRERKVADASG